MKIPTVSCNAVAIAVLLLLLSPATAETEVLIGEVGVFTGPDELHLDPATAVIAVDVFGNEDGVVNGVTFLTDGQAAGEGIAEANGVSVTTRAANQIDNWSGGGGGPEFTGLDQDSADALSEIMRDIRWEGAPNPVTIDIAGLTPGTAYEIQLLFNEGADRNRRWDIAVNDDLVVDDITSEGHSEEDAWDVDNSAYYKGEFTAPANGELNIVMQQNIGGQPSPGGDNNPILQGVIVHRAGATLPPFVGSWTFDGDAKDGSGNGNDGELVDAEFSDDVPRQDGGKSLQLEAGAHVLVPHAESLNITTAISIAAWVKPVGEIEWDGVIAKNPSDGSGNNHAGNYELRIENGGRHLHFLHQQGGADDTAFHQGLASIIEPDIWTHVVVTAETDSGDVNFYINGELSETLEGIIGVDEFPTNENPLFIGSRADLFTAFDGLLDEVVLHNAVLNETEVENLFENGLKAPGDSDGDGCSDFYEENNDLDPNDKDDAALDPDGDGLTNAQECALNTKAQVADSDEDGLRDGVETNTGEFVDANDTGTDPTRADTDRDGLPDGAETNTGTFVSKDDAGTDPHNPDTDGDNAKDGLEVSANTNPLDKASVPSNQRTVGNFTITHVWPDGNPQMNDVGGVNDFFEDIGDAEAIEVKHPIIHFHDNANAPIFQDESIPYPLWSEEFGDGSGPGDRNDFAILVEGQIWILNAGLATFVCNSDDGFELSIDGEPVGEAGNRGRGNTVMEVDLAEGPHDFRFIHWERGGGAGVSVYIYRGTGNAPALNADDWELLRAFEDLTDTDEDGIGDEAELACGLNPEDPSDAVLDKDGDGLSNLREFELGTGCNDDDTDDDGLKDNVETNTGIWVSATDTGTKPTRKDSDGDNLPDGAENNSGNFVSRDNPGTDPNNSDTDGDDWDDDAEIDLGSDPNDKNDAPGDVEGTVVITGEIVEFLGPDDLHLDPSTVVIAVDSFGDEDREVNGVLFQSDKTDNNSVGEAERDGVVFNSRATNFIDGWAAPPAFTGGQGDSAENLAAIMEDIRWEGAPNPVTVDIEGLRPGGTYELQLLVNEGADRNRRWDIAVEGRLAVDDFTSEGDSNEGVWSPENSFAYVGEFEVSDDGILNVEMRQHFGGQPSPGGDNNPILQGVILHNVGPGTVFQITRISRSATEFTITWASTPGREYSIEYNSELANPIWIELDDGVQSEGTETSFTDDEAERVAQPEGWYRVREN